MKLNKILAAFMLFAAVAFIGCEPPMPPDGPGNGQGNDKDTSVVAPEAPDTIGWNIPAKCLTIAEANAICAQLESGATTGTKYYVKGWIKKLANKHADGLSQFGNALFYMVDEKGNTDEDFYAYQVYGLNGEKITNPDGVAVGDYVVIYGELTNYNGTYETVGKGAAYIWKSTNPLLTDNGSGNQGNENPTEVVGDGSFKNPYTANDVLLLNNANAGKYWVKAYIVGQVNGAKMSEAEWNTPFSSSTNQSTGQLTGYNTNLLVANSADETNTDNCVPVQLPSGALRTGLNLVQHPEMDGQEILIYGSLEKYFGVAGVKSPEYAKVGDKEFGVNPNVEQKEPTAKVVTIKEFIDAPESTEVYYELTGVIGGTINTTYGNFDLTDETGTVYVYGLTKEFIAVGSTSNDKSYASLGLKEGDKITLRGFRGSYNGKIEVMGAYFVKLISSGNENPNPDEPEIPSHEWVDLGLSVKWATCNVGASSPEEYGNYYAWGEIEPKDYYSTNSTVTFGLSISELKSRGYIDSDGNLTSSYDAATANWGKEWRMPTSDEIIELRRECRETWAVLNGVTGYYLTGPNGKSIFLPAAGLRIESELSDPGASGYYWSSTPNNADNSDDGTAGGRYADNLYFSTKYLYKSESWRSYGMSIRPVLVE